MSKLEYSSSVQGKSCTNLCCLENPQYEIEIQFPNEKNPTSRKFCKYHKNLIETLAKTISLKTTVKEATL